MPKYLDACKKALSSLDMSFSEIPGKTALSLGMSGDNGKWRMYLVTQENKDVIMIQSKLSTNVPDDRKRDIAELLTRINYLLTVGNYEMDFSDGELQLRTSADFEGGKNIESMIKAMFVRNVMTFDRFLPAIMKVIYGGTSPEDALKDVTED